MPRVSVIIPTYNRAEYLGAAIESVLEQTCNDLEIIVVDDGSTDGTRSLAQRYHRSIRYIYLDHCGLSGVTRNRGIAAACGAYIAFLDSDDLWLPNKIERQLAYCAQHPHMGMIYSDAWYFKNETGEDLFQFHQQVTARSGWIGPHLLHGSFIPTPSVLIKRSVLEDVGLFNEAPAFRLGEDRELWLRIATRYQIGLVAEPLVRVRLHHGNISRQEDPLRMHKRGLALIDHVCALAPDVYAAAKPRAIFAQYHRTIGILVAQGRMQEARSLFVRAMQNEPTLSTQVFREAKVLLNAPVPGQKDAKIQDVV